VHPIRRKTRRFFLAATLLSFASAAASCGRHEDKNEGIIAAATSLRKTLPALIDTFEQKGKAGAARFTATYGASGELARQVEGGAAIDVVIFAAKDPVEKLVQAGLVDEKTARVVATNELVLVGTNGGKTLTFETITDMKAGERLAIGEPGAVPAGRYAKEALTRLGVWDAMKDRVVLGGNVAAVLAYVERGEAPFAIVYKTELLGAKGVVVLDTAKGQWAPLPEVWAAVTTHAKARAQALEFVEFMASPEGRRVFAQYGFGLPGEVKAPGAP